MCREELSQVGELRACYESLSGTSSIRDMSGVEGTLTVTTGTVKDLENVEHSHSCLQGGVVIRGNEVSYQCCFHDKSCHATQDCTGHVFISREEVHDKDSHDIDAESKGKPACWIEKLLDLAEPLDLSEQMF